MLALQYEITEEVLQDAIYLANGLFAPLEGFMVEGDYRSVVERMTLVDGSIWTIPITLDVSEDIFRAVDVQPEVILTFGQRPVFRLLVDSKFVIAREELIRVFATTDEGHPGLRKEMQRYPYRLGGRLAVLDEAVLEGALSPDLSLIHI